MRNRFRALILTGGSLIALSLALIFGWSRSKPLTIEIQPSPGYQFSTSPRSDPAAPSWHLTKSAPDLKVEITIETVDSGNLIYRLSRGLQGDDPLGGFRAGAQNQKAKNPTGMTIQPDTNDTLNGVSIRGFSTEEVRHDSFVVKRFGIFSLHDRTYKISGLFRFRKEVPSAVKSAQTEWETIFAALR